jgi:lipoyl(octanoyl) transferase
MLRGELRTSLWSPRKVAWEANSSLVPYPGAVARMDDVVAAIRGGAPERVWLLEHPPIYTAGTSANDADLIEPRFPVYRSGRGGQFTYHGPGQRVAYVMLDLRHRGGDLRAFVSALEEWIIQTLKRFGVLGERREDRVGVWVRRPSKGAGCEQKIAAIGVRIRHWISFHGISLNVSPDLSHFSGIIPCGVHEHGVTSLADLGLEITMADVDKALKLSFEEVFGPLSEGGHTVGRTENSRQLS